MIQLYNENEIIVLKSLRRKQYRILLLLAIICISLLWLMSYFLHEETKIIFFILYVTLSIGYAWTSLLYWNLTVLPLQKRTRFIKTLLRYEENTIQGEISDINQETITMNSLSFYECKIQNEKKKDEWILYLDATNDTHLHIGDDVTFIVRNNFICAYKLSGDSHE